RDFKPRRAFIVANEQIRHAQRKRIERTAGRNTKLAKSRAAQILHRTQKSRALNEQVHNRRFNASNIQGFKVLSRDYSKGRAFARTSDRGRILCWITKPRRSAADEIPPARRTQRIDSRLPPTDANRAGRNFCSRYVAARRRQSLRQPCEKWKTGNE